MAQVWHPAAHDRSLNEQLAECAREARKQAQLLPHGALRTALLEKARQYEAQISTNALRRVGSETKH